MYKPLDKKVRYGTEFENEDLKNYIDELWQYADFLEERQMEKLNLCAVCCCLTDKEKIDYEISQKRKDKEENLRSWGCSMFFTFMLFVGIFAIIKGCS